MMDMGFIWKIIVLFQDRGRKWIVRLLGRMTGFLAKALRRTEPDSSSHVAELPSSKGNGDAGVENPGHQKCVPPFAKNRVAAPVAGSGSHRTVLVPFTYGSSGPPVVTPAAGRVTTSPYPSSAIAEPGR